VTTAKVAERAPEKKVSSPTRVRFWLSLQQSTTYPGTFQIIDPNHVYDEYSDLKKRAEKAALIRLAAPFLKVLQAICVDGADDGNADDSAAYDDADDNADVNTDDNAARQTMDNDTDNDAAHRRRRTTQTTTLRPRGRATTQTTGKDADNDNAAADVNAAMQMIRWCDNQPKKRHRRPWYRWWGDVTTGRTRGTGGHGADDKVARQPADKRHGSVSIHILRTVVLDYGELLAYWFI
jgi:hypothetical protein